VDISEDKHAKSDIRYLPIDFQTPDNKARWFRVIDAIVKIYKLKKNNSMFNEYQNNLSERIYQILLTSAAFYSNNVEFMKRLVDQTAKTEWSEAFTPLLDPLFSFLGKITGAARDGTLRTSEDAMESFSPLEKIIGSMNTKWGRLNEKGHGPEVEKMSTNLEALESNVHRLENIVVPFVNDLKNAKKNVVPQFINKPNFVQQPITNRQQPITNQQVVINQQVYIETQPPPEEIVIDEDNMTEIEKQIYHQKQQYSNLDRDDPNAAILNALMDLNDLS